MTEVGDTQSDLPETPVEGTPVPGIPVANKAEKVVPPRPGPSAPVDGEAAGEEETRVFRREYFDGKTRAQVQAILEDAERTGKTNKDFMRAGREALEDLDALEGGTKEVDGIAVETAEDAMNALRDARKPKRRADKKGEKFEISIADQTIENPERAYENFLEAIALVKKQLPGFIKIRVEDIKFQKLAGDVVGKSSSEGTTIDPIMLLHPVMRIATVLFHETLHAHNYVPNEGLVHAQTEMHFGGMKAVEEYDQAVAKFTKFADIYGKGDIDDASKEIYKLYYRASKDNKPIYYMAIYNRFAKRARKLSYFKDEPAIKQFFNEVFPELKMVDVG